LLPLPPLPPFSTVRFLFLIGDLVALHAKTILAGTPPVAVRAATLVRAMLAMCFLEHSSRALFISTHALSEKTNARFRLDLDFPI
jgi:hypothetical protein